MSSTLPTVQMAAPEPEHATLCAAFQATVAADPERVALRTPGDDVRVTWGDYDERIRATAARLSALGVRRGDTVALLLRTRPEAAWADAAAMHLGAVAVSLYLAAPPAGLAYVLRDAGARVLVTERALAGRVAGLRRACPALEHVIGIDGAAPGVTPLEDVPADAGLDFDAAWAVTRPDDVLTLMYTSGTTGAPKGTVYTHGAVAQVFACLDADLPELDDIQTIAFLPFAHAGQRAMGHYRAMLTGATTTFCADPGSLPAVIREARPTHVFAPPRVWELLAAGAEAVIAAEPDATRRDRTQAALERALERVRARRAGGHAAAARPGDAELLAAVRARLGLERVAQPLISGAPAPPALLERLHALGLPVMNLYALTEVPPITVTGPDPTDIGTAGRPIAGVRLRLGDDGEVLVQHPAASSGYHGRPAQTAALFGADGWARTGDLGTLDDESRLTLTGRRDEQIVTSLGTNIDPVAIEQALTAASPLIAQACVIGHGRPHVVALIAADPGARPEAEIAAAVERVNQRLPETARVRRFAVLDDRWVAGGEEITPTHKLRRRAIEARYADRIAALYHL